MFTYIFSRVCQHLGDVIVSTLVVTSGLNDVALEVDIHNEELRASVSWSSVIITATEKLTVTST